MVNKAVRFTARFGMALWVAVLGSGFAQAAESTSPSIYVEGGGVSHHGTETTASAVGLRLPVQRTFWDGRVSVAWDLYVSNWRTEALPGERTHFTQIGVVPMFRYRFDAGRSRWFVEGGVGASYLNATYRTPGKVFSTRWNFSDHLGVGRNFGATRQHELGVYVKHVSNAGVRRPNPGETLLQLRYAYAF